jgi:hypothetical protein
MGPGEALQKSVMYHFRKNWLAPPGKTNAASMLGFVSAMVRSGAALSRYSPTARTAAS